MKRIILLAAALLVSLALASSAAAATTHVPGAAGAATAHRSCTYGASGTVSTGNAGSITVHMSTNTCGLKWVARVGCKANSGTTTNWFSSSADFGTGSRTAGCFNGSHPYEGGFDVWNNAGTKFWNELWPTKG